MYKPFALLLIVSPFYIPLSSYAGDVTNDTTAARPSTLKTLTQIQKNVAQELDTLFDKTEPTEDLAPDLRSNLEQLHDTASEIKRQTGKLLKSRKNRTASVWDSMFRDMERSQKAFGKFFSDVRKDFGTRSAAANYKINEFQSDDGQSYGISISMPEFTEDQISVSIEETKKNHSKINVLKIKAQTEAPQKVTSKSDGKTILRQSSQQVVSSRSVNGRHQYINYKDGKLDAVIDLPQTIRSDQYTMTFENNILKIEFEIEKKPEDTVKKLEFKEKKNNGK